MLRDCESGLELRSDLSLDENIFEISLIPQLPSTMLAEQVPLEGIEILLT